MEKQFITDRTLKLDIGKACKRQLKNVAKHLGVTMSSLVKIEISTLLSRYPDSIKEKEFSKD